MIYFPRSGTISMMIEIDTSVHDSASGPAMLG